MNDIERGSRVRIDLSDRFEDVDGILEGEVYRVDEDKILPYYVEADGRVFQVSDESIIGLVDTDNDQ